MVGVGNYQLDISVITTDIVNHWPLLFGHSVRSVSGFPCEELSRKAFRLRIHRDDGSSLDSAAIPTVFSF